VFVVLLVGVLFMAAGTAYAATRYDQTDPNIVYSGTWSTYTDGTGTLGFFGPSIAYGQGVGTDFTFRFTGTGAEWSAWTGPNYGGAEVIVDGGTPQPANLGFGTYAIRTVWTTSGLENKTHLVEVHCTGVNGPNGIPGISVDSLNINGSLQPTWAVPASSPWSLAFLGFAGMALAGASLAVRKRVTA
jgi:hypothetical protein